MSKQIFEVGLHSGWRRFGWSKWLHALQEQGEELVGRGEGNAAVSEREKWRTEEVADADEHQHDTKCSGATES